MDDVREELGIADINTIIENSQYKWLEHFERMDETEPPNLPFDTNGWVEEPMDE
jgi:hypothetical protein